MQVPRMIVFSIVDVLIFIPWEINLAGIYSHLVTDPCTVRQVMADVTSLCRVIQAVAEVDVTLGTDGEPVHHPDFRQVKVMLELPAVHVHPVDALLFLFALFVGFGGAGFHVEVYPGAGWVDIRPVVVDVPDDRPGCFRVGVLEIQGVVLYQLFLFRVHALQGNPDYRTIPFLVHEDPYHAVLVLEHAAGFRVFLVFDFLDNPGGFFFDIVGVKNVQPALSDAKDFPVGRNHVFHPAGNGDVFKGFSVGWNCPDSHQLAIQVGDYRFRFRDGNYLPGVSRLRVKDGSDGFERTGFHDLDFFRVVHGHEVFPVNQRDGLGYISHGTMIHVLEYIHDD